MDNQSLIIALALVSLTTGVMLFVNWAGNRLVPGLFSIALGSSLTATGVLLLVTQNNVTPVVSIMLSNALVMGGRLPLLTGLANFWNQEKSQLPLVCSIWFVVTIVGFYYFTFIDESVAWRIRLYSSMMIVFSLSNVYILANGLKIERKLRPAMAVSSNYGAYLLIGLYSLYTVLEIVSVLIRPSIPLADPGAGTSLLLLSALFTMLVTAFAVIIMTMEELSVEHKENSIFDPITTILNQRTFMEVSYRVLGVALRYSQPVSLITIEIDNLDKVIKTYGIKLTNDLLRHFAMQASNRRRNEDVFARCGYRDFRMLLPGVGEMGCEIVVNKIKESLASEEFIYRGQAVQLDITISFITKREEDLHLQQMLHEGEVDLFRIRENQQST